jgi:hypothetical protein
MDDHVVTGLAKRRAELIAEAKAAEATHRRALADIEHIDCAIRAYDPSQRPRKVRISRATRTDLSRVTLDTLRQASAPMTLRAITDAVMTRTGQAQGNRKAVNAVVNRVRAILTRNQKRGLLVASPGPGQALLWAVAA